ncbi:hypothetical protein [Candidatus Thiosymbion oneisti]|uniref:hypothetical protein n=1 Tax=Candidatus Thiosymbion oneisti TaxID=589554 RepID=UPI000B7FCA6D|nr:hypothetical protein [Candidatus Thiosymbion oneisti]
MIRNKRLVLAAAVAGTTALTTFSAEAFFGPFNAMRGWGGSPWGWDYPYYGWGHPYYGGWGHPYYGGWGHPYYGGWGYPRYGGWGYPYYGAWGHPYWGGIPYLGYPAVTAPAPATPASSSDK